MKTICIYPILFFLFTFMVCKKNTNKEEGKINLPEHQLNAEADLDALLAQIGEARIVLLGEASHGTSEFYTWRAAISKRLMQEKGFDMIAVEGEWADSYRVNQFIKGEHKDSAQAVELLRQYDRWPTWMWGNYETASLVSWLNNFNQNKSQESKVGFYGLDVYCLWESMQEMMPHIQNNDSLKAIARQVQRCFQPFSADPGQYAYAVAKSSANCRRQTEKLWQSAMAMTGGTTSSNEAEFLIQQNALVALNGENYYRTSLSSYPESWNIRDRHMTSTISRLLQLHGPDSKIIVWEHNTHVGDARFTDMAEEGMVNVGQLVRQQFGEDKVYIVGFGTHSGTVVASPKWGGPVQSMIVPAAQKGSLEDILHQQGSNNRILFSNELVANKTLLHQLGHRAIGVVYRPSNERGNYVPTVLPRRYDAFIYIDRTTALHPIEGLRANNDPPDTYPSGY